MASREARVTQSTQQEHKDHKDGLSKQEATEDAETPGNNPWRPCYRLSL